MTVTIMIGRRVSKKWMKRISDKTMGLINFQTNIWVIISQSLHLAKRKATENKTLEFCLTKKIESEDLYYNLEWIEVMITGTKEQELEEYKEALGLYDNLSKIVKKDMPKDENMEKHFKSRFLSMEQVEDAYKKGYGVTSDSNLAQKLLEMGILTVVKFVDDFETRDVVIPKP
jgi:hypothetical protein